MIEMGVENEIKTLIKKHPNEKYPEIIGLKELISYIKGASLFEEMVKKAQQMTRNYAKRQITWFKHQMDYDIINTN
jgi:tRNA dimethylallyltransferase